MAAFAGESQARNKYDYYASKAKKDGYEQIAAIFQETANNEKEHAKMWFKLFHGINATVDNLTDAAAGENYEWTEMYKDFARIADEEAHEDRYNKLVKNIENGEVFARLDENVWVCRNCGHIHIGKSAPELCPVCAHPQAYFELRNDNY